MGHVFISHFHGQNTFATDVGRRLRGAGFETWIYEEDTLPGPSYLLQVSQAIDQADAVVLILSAEALGSDQVGREIIRAFEGQTPFLPILFGVTIDEVAARRPEWRTALGASTGIGVGPDDLDRVFDRLCRGLEAMDVARTLPDRHAPAAEPTDQAGAKHALWVDDEESVLNLGKILFKHDGRFSFHTAGTVQEGCDAFDRIRPDIVILDMSLPGGSGKDVLRHIRSHDQTPVVIVSGYVNKTMHPALFALGANDVISKPFRAGPFMDRVAELVAGGASAASNPVPEHPPSGGDTAAALAVEPSGLASVQAQAASVRDLDVQFTDQARDEAAAQGLDRQDVLDLVESEFRSHANYFRFDLENYPLPLRSTYIVYISKVGPRLEIARLLACTRDQATLASWSDILTAYRRATRFAYRRDPHALLRSPGMLERTLSLHNEMRHRIVRHYARSDSMGLDLTVQGALEMMEDGTREASIQYHLDESLRADGEARDVAESMELGDILADEGLSLEVIALERSLQHIHKILLTHPPVTDDRPR